MKASEGRTKSGKSQITPLAPPKSESAASIAIVCIMRRSPSRRPTADADQAPPEETAICAPEKRPSVHNGTP